jgi:hypothetical protein
LSVQEIGTKESEAVSVTVKDEAGKTLAAAILGKRNDTLYGKSGGGTYLRRGGEAQAWLAEGVVKMGVTHKDWVDKIIVSLPKKDVRKHPAKENVAARRFELDKMPAGKKRTTPRSTKSSRLDPIQMVEGGGCSVARRRRKFELHFDGLVVRGGIIARQLLDRLPPKWRPTPERRQARETQPRSSRAGLGLSIAAGYGETVEKRQVTEDANPATSPHIVGAGLRVALGFDARVSGATTAWPGSPFLPAPL